jgi:hypothetical protein
MITYLFNIVLSSIGHTLVQEDSILSFGYMDVRHNSSPYLHTLVENVSQRYHKIYLEDFVSQLDP